ncbi:MAG: NAD(P)/FAD-dependent oxidoreductase [Opitutales bacterium]|nr:NAD(P)/FAD-dependent oxidoreductase [Opitutales bacterium]
MESGDYDIVIVGGGPSGAMAAFSLAKHYRVLVLERFALPREKSCSGVLVRKSLDCLSSTMGMPPDSVCCSPKVTSGLAMHTLRRVYEFEDPGMNIVRSRFDYWMLRCAEERGATLRDRALVTDMVPREDSIELCGMLAGARFSLRASLVLACDGVNGNSRRICRLPPQNKVVTCQKFYRADIDMDRSKFVAFTSPEFSRYDAWVNSKDGCVVVGSIAADRREATAFQSVFEGHLKEAANLRINEELRCEYWSLPLVQPGNEPVLNAGRVFFCGEAAGLLNPFGEGMSIGMASAKAISEVICGYGLADMECLAVRYKAALQTEVSYMKRQWALLYEIAPEFRANAAGIVVA